MTNVKDKICSIIMFSNFGPVEQKYMNLNKILKIGPFNKNVYI